MLLPNIMFFINRLIPSVCQLLLLLLLLAASRYQSCFKTRPLNRTAKYTHTTLHKHYTKYTIHKHSHMRRSNHPSGFSSFDPTTFSLAKLLVIITIAYHRKCDKMVIIVKDTTNSNSHVQIGLLPPCPHHLYYNNNNNSSHFEAPFHNVWTNCTQV